MSSAKRRHRRERARAIARGTRIASSCITDREVAKLPLPGIRLTEPGEINPNALKMSPARFKRLTGLTGSEFKAAAALSDAEFEAAMATGVRAYLRDRAVPLQPLEAAE